MNNNNLANNEKGLTLLELLISIIVGSIVISMLMSVLVMSLKAKATFDVNTRMLDESYYIVEKIQSNFLKLGPQEIEITTVGTVTTITFSHVYDIALDAENVVFRDYTITPVIHKIIYDSTTTDLIYEIDGSQTNLNSYRISIANGSSLELINVNSNAGETCDFDSTSGIDLCDQAVLKLNLYISVDLNNGGSVDPKMFITTIIV